MTGVSDVDDPGHQYGWLDTTGTWQGGAMRDREVRLGRMTSKDVVPGMSGAPVRRLSDDVVIGVVSARYNSVDGWLRDSVWVARTEHLQELLDDFQDDEDRMVAMRQVRLQMSDLIAGFDAKFPEDFRDKLIFDVRDEKIFTLRTARALVFGRTMVGKTTTINYLLEAPVFPATGQLTCTRSLAAGEHRNGLIFYDSPGLGDEPYQHNITCAALGLPQMDDEGEVVQDVRLIDITTNQAEGPDSHRTLGVEDFSGEISDTYYDAHRDYISFKSFAAADLAAWLGEKIDFLVFVASAGQSGGLYRAEVNLLREISKNMGETPLFKVFNVFDAGFHGKVASLPAASIERIEQAKQRLHKAGIQNPEDWIVVDSATGVGLDELVKAFAAMLPVDVLRSLQNVVRERYAEYIESRLDESFLDYAGHIAALTSVFPVDFQYDDADFLHFAVASLFTVAEYIFVERKQSVPAELLDTFVDELRSHRTKPRYKRRTEQVEVSVPGPFTGFLERNFSLDMSSWYGRKEIRNKRRKQRAGDRYLHGGIRAIEVILAFTLALREVNLFQFQEPTDHQRFQELIEKGQQIVASGLTQELGLRLDALLSAKPEGSVEDRASFANETVFPSVRELLAIAAEDSTTMARSRRG